MSPPSLNFAERHPRDDRPRTARRTRRKAAAILSFARFHSLAQIHCSPQNFYEVGRKYWLTGNYERGGMATVYVACDKRTNKAVVLKVPNQEKDPKNPVNHQSMLRELRALSLLDHPNIVRLIDIDHHEGHDFSVLSYVRGSDLSLILREFGKLDWQTTKAFLLQLCDALQVVHDTHIVHADVKPGNVMIEVPSLKPVLVDFGSARFTGIRKERFDMPSLDLIGSYPHMAPEMIEADSYDHRVDIHGLGLLAYEVLTSENPFSDHTPLATMLNVLTYIPPPPSTREHNIPVTVDPVIMRALAKDPADRFSTISEMREAIASIN